MEVMIIEVHVHKLNCFRCGHKWIPRKEDVRLCPKCKSAYFDRPKTDKENSLKTNSKEKEKQDGGSKNSRLKSRN